MLNLTALAVVVLFSVTGCTRGSNKTGTVALKFKTSESVSMSTSDLVHVVINVSGGNLKQAAFLQWDRHDCQSGACAIPPYWEIKDIPSGGTVYIQVLTVYEDSVTEQLTFKYSDANKSINQGTNEISLTPVTIGGATTQANFYGRYLDRDVAGVATGPTGTLETRFKPPASASIKSDPPALLIMSNPVIAGWMSLFALDGDAKFDYYLNGALFMKNVDIASLQSKANGNSALVQIDIPDYERANYQGGAQVGLQPEKAQKIFIGYMGPQVGTQLACYSNLDGGAIADAFVAGTSGASNLQWYGNTRAAATSSRVSPQYGGTPFSPGDTSQCDTSSTEFADHMVFNYLGLRNGHDSVTNFRGPFRAVTSYGDFVNALSANNSGVSLEVNMLPGTTDAGVIGALRVFQRASTGSDSGLYGSGDGIQCSTLANKGFKVLADVAVTTGQTAIRANFPNVANPQGLDLVVCPMLASGVLVDAGVKANGIRQPAVFKIIGGDGTKSSVKGPGINGTEQLLKSAFLNNFHNIAFEIANQMVTPSHVAAAYASVDDGAWFSVTTSSYFFNDAQTTISFIPITSSNTALFSALGGGASRNVRFKVQLSAFGISSFGSEKAEIISNSIRLIGSNDCGSPGTLQAYDLNSPAGSPIYFNSGNLLAVATTADADKHRFQMRWPGCGDGTNWAAAPLDYMDISGGSGCFSSTDITRANSLEIQIDPKDTYSAQGNCNLSGVNAYFKTPSNAGSDNVFGSGSGITINHSTVAKSLGLLAVATTIGNMVDLQYFYDFALIGPSNNFAAGAVQLNDDRRWISLTSLANAVTSWLNMPDWFASAPPNGMLVSFQASAAPLMGPLRLLNGTDPGAGNASGGMAIGVGAMGNVVAASDSSLNSGSALMLVDNGAAIKIGYVPSNSGNYVGQNILMFPLPADIPAITGATKAFIQLVPTPGYNNVFIAIQTGTTSYFAYGRILGGMGSSISFDWAASVNSPSDQLNDVKLTDVSGSKHILIAHRLTGTDFIQNVTPPTKTGAWSANALGSSQVLDLTVSSYTGIVGIANCSSNDPWIIVRGTSNYFYLLEYNASTNTTVQRASPGVSVASHNSAACKAFGSGGRLFVSYDKASNSSYALALDDSGGSCGAGSYVTMPWNGGTPTLPTPSSGGYRSVFDSYMGMSFVYDSGGKTVVTSVNPTCTSGVTTFNSSTSGTQDAQFNTTASSINGAAVFTGNGPAGLVLFGNNSQYYQMHSR